MCGLHKDSRPCFLANQTKLKPITPRRGNFPGIPEQPLIPKKLVVFDRVEDIVSSQFGLLSSETEPGMAMRLGPREIELIR